jgi:hypothetical protein
VPAWQTVDISAAWLAGAPALPDRCVRHGLPAARRVTFAVRSNPWTGAGAKVFLPGYAARGCAEEYAKQVRMARVSGWPLCRTCARRRCWGLTAAVAFLIGGVTASLAGDGTAPTVLLGFAAILLSPVLLSWASLGSLSRAELSGDGTAVHVTGASPGFTAQLPRR